MGELKSSGKPFEISKWAVAQAWEKVKANKGAPGVDEVTVEEFEADLQNNLYKVWNRMSSGSYFPPAVRAVEIPKPHDGGTRMLGVPTVADRVAQTVAALQLAPRMESIFHDDSYGYRPGRSALDAVGACRARCWKTDWVIDCDIQKFFDSVSWDLMKSGGGQHRSAVGDAVCETVATSPDTASRRNPATTGPGNPARVSSFARAGKPVLALCVRYVDGSGVPDRAF